jgi:hypothetical protein
MPADGPAGYLVYVRGSRGPVAQKWRELFFGVAGDKKTDVLAHYPLPEIDWPLPFHVLERLYPPPAS